ncbi:nucleotide disphospho-sugar-binding domain-containing protein [Kitasatospora sp. NPDC098652]|uniref:nucleotide disphospho-sugar-binding domain-containing protein n=1 Tax=Kitasatospora sp. NPDC098652 TaxID=3364095 RepID=UPI0037F1C443
MRVLFTPLPVGSHLYHQVSLAWAFRAAGHEVRVASQASLTKTTLSTGLTAVEVGDDYDFMASMAAMPESHRISAAALMVMSEDERRAMGQRRSGPLIELNQRLAPDLLRFAEEWRPDLLVTDPTLFAAPLVSAVLGIPIIRNIWGPDIIFGHPLQGQPNTGAEREQWHPGLVELFDRYGAEVRNDYITQTVDPWPASLRTFGAANPLPRRYVAYNGAGAAPDWILKRTGKPRVCVTWGTTTSVLGGHSALLPRVVDALAPLDIELVVTVSSTDRASLTGLPDNVRVVENLPLNLLMPSCDAIVNQGGTGSVLTAAAAGVPQVLVPEISEAPTNAISFTASGASVLLEPAELTAEAVAAAVTAVLTDDTIRKSADRIREEIAAMPSPASVVSTVEALVAA